MKTRFLGFLALLVATALPASAADLVGKWTAEFDSPIGVQKYVYEFKKSGDALAGQASYDHSMGKGTVDLSDVKVDGDKVAFVERLSVNGMDLTVTYSGTLSGDELKLTRNVGEFGSEELTAKRAK
jgi:opacity protein-like surface antigen